VLPDEYLDRPLLVSGTEFLWNAFWELTTDRQLGFGAEGRIPATSIRTFARDHGIEDPDDYAWFLAVMREMDAEYLGQRVPRGPHEIVNQTPMTDLKGLRGLFRKHAKKPAATTEA